MRRIAARFAVAVLLSGLLVAAAWAKEGDPCSQDNNFPRGFSIAAFGMSQRQVMQFSQCGLVSLGEEDGAYSFAGKYNKFDVIYEFTITPKAKKLFKIQLETLSSDLFTQLREQFIKQVGQPGRDDKGRETWVDSKSGATIVLSRSKSGFRFQMIDKSYLLAEAMGYFCEAYYSLPKGLGPFSFGMSADAARKALGCGFRPVNQEDKQIVAQGYAFNQPATLTLGFTANGNLQIVEYSITDLDAYPLIEATMAEKFGASAGGTWTKDGIQVSLTKGGTGILVRFVGPAQ
jgi:hypothetical protein